MRPVPLFIAGLTLLALTAAAGAQDGAARDVIDRRYFMEFRARDGGVVGHTFIVHGRIDGRGRTSETGNAGFYPDDKYSESILPALVPVPAYVNVNSEDPSFGSVSAVYRRRLSARQYAQLQLTLARLRARHGRWHLVFNNCNDFASVVAREMGLWTPPTLMRPDVFVNGLRALNGQGY